MLIVRQATPADATQIAEIIHAAFGQPASHTQIAGCISLTDTRLYVAEIDNLITGFAYAFITQSQAGLDRQELDLLAVHPDYHQRGIGTALIRKTIDASYELDCIRALVAEGNHPMEKTLTRLGFTAEATSRDLYVSTASSPPHPVPEDAHLIHIRTLTYNGIWLEGTMTTQAIKAALGAKHMADDTVGTLIPKDQHTLAKMLLDQSFTFIKRYRWWQSKL